MSLPQIPTARERISTSSGPIDGCSSSVTTASPGPLRSRAFMDAPLSDFTPYQLLGSWLATYDKRIKTIHNDGFRDGPAGEQFYAPGRQPDLLCDRAMIEYEPVVGALMHPAYYLYIVRRRHSRSYACLVKYLAHEQSLPKIVQRRTNVDDSPGSESLQSHSGRTIKRPASIGSKHLCPVYFQVIHPHISTDTMCGAI